MAIGEIRAQEEIPSDPGGTKEEATTYFILSTCGEMSTLLSRQHCIYSLWQFHKVHTIFLFRSWEKKP